LPGCCRIQNAGRRQKMGGTASGLSSAPLRTTACIHAEMQENDEHLPLLPGVSHLSDIHALRRLPAPGHLIK
ncbi:MAG TPA: hypothetical protein VN019_01080, partial [Oxalicibacterium sp.]|nr:hypothetical protein [Oxalicibacterium sp.]